MALLCQGTTSPRQCRKEKKDKKQINNELCFVQESASTRSIYINLPSSVDINNLVLIFSSKKQENFYKIKFFVFSYNLTRIQEKTHETKRP